VASTASSAAHTRRDFLYVATGAVAAVRAAAYAAWPLILADEPRRLHHRRRRAGGSRPHAPIAEGQLIKVFWRGKPIFVRITARPKEIKEAEDVQICGPCRDPQAGLRAGQGRPHASG
jgi:ubiquinol-cytochrome c reductase iron-sulfur subunit